MWFRKWLIPITTTTEVSRSMRKQTVRYAVLPFKIPGCGYTDEARLILQFGHSAFLFGKHDGRTLVVEILTSGFLLRSRLLRTL